MSFKSVYRSLQEVFPQVDLRILKAVAIEHSADVDAAVEFILSEVLPSLNAPQEDSHTHHDAEEDNHKSPEVQGSSLSFASSSGKAEANSSLHSYPVQSTEKENFPGTETSAALHASSLSWAEEISDGSSVGLIESEKIIPLKHEEFLDEAAGSKPSKTTALTFENFHVIHTTSDCVSTPPLGESVVTGQPSVIQDAGSSGQSWIHGDIEEPAQLEKSHPRLTAGSSYASNLIECEDSVVDWSSPLLADTQGLTGLDFSSVSENSQSFSTLSREDNMGSVQLGLTEEKVLGTCSGHGEELIFSVDAGADILNLDSENPSNCEHPTMSVSTRSGQVVSIDFLEDFVTDCKGIKNTLVSAMESIVDMMKEVDLRENEANLAKEAASKAGLDILAKVEDLKEMLKHAQEANNMHAGEVYGEKSILATEARELQSRLLTLSDERDKSLAIIEEIRQTLEARLDTADRERIKAEQEKLEKEETARKALIEQEYIMDRVVQESKKLQQEAEENSKLREFLMERGHLVDTLQGEISVICEDVFALKERVDGRMPLGRSLSKSQILSTLASSTSSRTSSSSEKLPCPVESSENRMGSQDTLKTHQLEGSNSSGEKSIGSGADHRASSDDDWECFDGEAELCH